MLDEVTLYVAPHARALGVSRPGVPSKSCIDRKCATHTSDWRFDPGSPENHHRVERVYVPTSLEELTRRRYRSEAHFVAYELFDVKTGLAIGAQPRLKKDCLGWLREQGYDVRLVAFLVDVDTPGHVPWTPELRAEFDELWARREGTLLDRCGAYLSPKGYRLCQPLAKPLPVEEGERALKLFLHRIVEENKVWASARDVSDWTRNMRTPHHNRQGVLIESPWQDWAKLGVLEPEVPAEAPQRVRAKRTNAAHAPRPVDRFDEVCPAGWEPVADEVGVAIRDTVTADWRRCYLALAGALLERGCPPEGVPAVVRRAAEAAGAGDKLGDRVTIATDTVLRWSANVDVSGASVLRLKFPAVAEAIDESISSGAESSILRQLRGKERTITDVTEATNTLRREIRDAYGTVLIAGPPGLGKTESVIEHAKSLKRIEERATSGQRVALSAPTTQLATEIQERADRAGVRTLRVFGPLSHRTPQGEYTCIHRESAEPLVGGGQSLKRLFCEPDRSQPCENALLCPAKSGFVGDTKANLVLGPHELLGSMAAYVGKGGTIVIDEPPPLVRSHPIFVRDFASAISEAAAFEKNYADRMVPVLHALSAWASSVKPGDTATAHEAVERGLEGVPRNLLPSTVEGESLAAVLIERAQAATGEARSIAPPLTAVALAIAKKNPARAQVVGAASGVFLAVFRALQPPQDGLQPMRLRVVERDEVRVVSFVGANELIVDTLRRDAPTVMLDASAQLVAPAVEKIVGHQPRIVVLDVSDGAPVSRTVLATGKASRTRIVPRGQVDLDALIPLVRAALAWAKESEETSTLVLVSWRPVVALIKSALGDADAAESLKRGNVTQKLAREFAQRVEDMIAPWRGRVKAAHYGGLRGLDHLKHFDALATVGDPRPTIDAEADRCAWLEVDADGRIDELAAAELDQAHGRLRLIHRDRPARALHVGNVLPAGWASREVVVRRMAVGRPRTASSALLTGERLRALREARGASLRSLAVSAGVSHESIRGWEAGKPIPPKVAARLVEVLEWL